MAVPGLASIAVHEKLKKLLAERDLEIDVMKEVSRKKW